MTFIQKLEKTMQRNDSLVCVGLDSDVKKLPSQFCKREDGQYDFNREIIDATQDQVCAYKLNSAFYEGEGANGIRQLEQTVRYLRQSYKYIPVILDYKRADISSTNIGSIRFAFEYLKVDAITLQPYLGREALSPFLDIREKGFFILCKTSNPGSDEFQNLHINGKPLYEIVAEHVATNWNSNKNCMLVVGATYPRELKKVREIVGDMTLLIPGIGTQGGDLEKTLEYGLTTKKQGLLLNSSRGIIFASSGKDFANAARVETKKLQDKINTFRYGIGNLKTIS